MLVEQVGQKAIELGLRVVFVNPSGTSKFAFDGSGTVLRDPKNHTLAVFRNGKRYHADLNASYNIGARYWFKQLGGGNNPECEAGKSLASQQRTPVTLSTLWKLGVVDREAATALA